MVLCLARIRTHDLESKTYASESVKDAGASSLLGLLLVGVEDGRVVAGLGDHAQVQVKLVDLGVAVAQNLFGNRLMYF